MIQPGPGGGKQVVKTWLDHLETQLQAEADHAGLLGHGTSIGNAREFVIRRVLRSFLPDCLTIGQGRVVDAQGKMSNQIDVVIFDNRYPAFRYPDGQAIYPVEGVVATAEVKSTWDADEVHKALDNCKSVMDLKATLDEPFILSVISPQAGLPGGINRLLRPSTYCFGFKGLKADALHNAIQSWADKQPSPSADFPFPDVFVSGSAVALAFDQIITPGSGGMPALAQLALGTVNTERRFGWLAGSLLSTIDRWLDFQPQGMKAKRLIKPYNPISEYIKEVKSGPESSLRLLTWKLKP